MRIEEFRARADRLRAAMADRGLDAMLLYGSNLNGCGHPTYLANYIVKLPFAALVVLPRVGDAALMFQGAIRGRSAAQATTWIADVRPCWDMADTCLQVLSERGLTTARIGLAAMPRLVPHHDWAKLADGLRGATLLDAEDLVDRQRAIKSAAEIAQIEHASQIVRNALATVGHAPPSAGERRVVADLMCAARTAGAEDIRVSIARPGEDNWAFRPVDDVAFAGGDVVAVLLSASWERYWSESIRTFRVAANRFEPLGEPDLEARFGELRAGLRPGLTTGQWSGAALDRMSPAERTAIAPYGLGNGIGITPEEWPMLEVGGEATIERGMCLAVRAAFAAGDGLALRGDTIVV